MPGLPLAAGEGTGRGPAASPHIRISPHPMSAALGSRTCWDRSADQTFLSVYSILMDVGDPKFSVGAAVHSGILSFGHLLFCIWAPVQVASALLNAQGLK